MLIEAFYIIVPYFQHRLSMCNDTIFPIYLNKIQQENIKIHKLHTQLLQHDKKSMKYQMENKRKGGVETGMRGGQTGFIGEVGKCQKCQEQSRYKRYCLVVRLEMYPTHYFLRSQQLSCDSDPCKGPSSSLRVQIGIALVFS